MTEIISVRFKKGGKEYYFNPNGMQFQPGQSVIIETARGVEFGECTQGNNLVDEMTLVSPLRPVLRAATPEDEQTLEQNKKKEARAFEICEKKIAEHGLDMKLVEVEYNFEGSKILFFFTSDGRVDFRELVKDLASVFHTRIELRQIGVRDEAKMLGGLGVCGRPFCCSEFLEEFQPVSIKMAKTQNLSLNPVKISGACGRLMCCLKYEQDAYEDALKRCPKNESLVETPDGIGTVCAVNLLREQAKVRLDQSPDNPQNYACEDIKVIRSGKGKRPEGYELQEPAVKESHLREIAPPTPVRPCNTERKGDPFGEVPSTIAQAKGVSEELEVSTEVSKVPGKLERAEKPVQGSGHHARTRKKSTKPAPSGQNKQEQSQQQKKEGQPNQQRRQRSKRQQSAHEESGKQEQSQRTQPEQRGQGNKGNQEGSQRRSNSRRNYSHHRSKSKGGGEGSPKGEVPKSESMK